MGLLKRMLSRGLSGVEIVEPPDVPPTPAWEMPPEPVVGLEHWRHPVSLGAHELSSYGFEKAAAPIQAAFGANGQTIELLSLGSELALNSVRVPTEQSPQALSLQHRVTAEVETVDALVWAVTVALHDAYLEPLDPERSWQIAGVGEGYVLFLARPEELLAIARRPEIDRILELGKLQPI